MIRTKNEELNGMLQRTIRIKNEELNGMIQNITEIKNGELNGIIQGKDNAFNEMVKNKNNEIQNKEMLINELRQENQKLMKQFYENAARK